MESLTGMSLLVGGRGGVVVVDGPVVVVAVVPVTVVGGAVVVGAAVVGESGKDPAVQYWGVVQVGQALGAVLFFVFSSWPSSLHNSGRTAGNGSVDVFR